MAAGARRRDGSMMTNVAAASDITVFIARRDVTCGECGEALGRHAWITLDRDRGALCLACADLDHLVFLPAGDPAARHDGPRSTRPSRPWCWNGAAHANVTSGRACWWRKALWPKLKRNAWPTPIRGNGAARVKSSAAPKKTRSMWRALPRPSASCIRPAHLAVTGSLPNMPAASTAAESAGARPPRNWMPRPCAWRSSLTCATPRRPTTSSSARDMNAGMRGARSRARSRVCWHDGRGPCDKTETPLMMEQRIEKPELVARVAARAQGTPARLSRSSTRRWRRSTRR